MARLGRAQAFQPIFYGTLQTASEARSGSLSATISAITLSAAGALSLAGAGSAVIGSVSASADADLLITGSGSSTLGAITSSAEGVVGDGLTGTLNAQIPSISVTADADLEVTGSLSSSLGLIALSATGITSAGYPTVSSARSIRLPAGGIWIIDPDVPAWCEVDWSAVIPDGVTLGSVSYSVPDGLTADDVAIDEDAGKWAIHLDGITHGAMYQIPLIATLSNAQTISLTAPLRCFNG